MKKLLILALLTILPGCYSPFADQQENIQYNRIEKVHCEEKGMDVKIMYGRIYCDNPTTP